ncbi:uncharacterized protein LOC117639053 [Thrips palmi]|uniref:Uncharacterized protein LOC117639053 n=1 Tax=Thrips palmi TaxID=161013 RepID=A0A6P8Y2N8_THRPL|nr:uncharacterized protein LOC117639053 [Thrips palmi]
MRVPVSGTAGQRFCRLLDVTSHVFFVHFLVNTRSLSGCVQLFGPPLQARDFEYRMRLDDADCTHHGDRARRGEMIHNLFQGRLRHGGGGGGGADAAARVLGVDEDPEHVLRGARAWRVHLGLSRAWRTSTRAAKTPVRVTVTPSLTRLTEPP